jgi:hypothetical protein
VRPLLLCSLLVGCGFVAPDLPTAQPDAATPPQVTSTTPQSFIEQLVTEECVDAFACKAQYPSNASTTFDDAWGTDLTDCVVTDHDYLARDKIAAAVTGGTITFDLASALACLAAPGVPAVCSTLFANTYDWADTCYFALAGHVAQGGACTTSWECSERVARCTNAKCSH